jgi:hypothetical protein
MLDSLSKLYNITFTPFENNKNITRETMIKFNCANCDEIIKYKLRKLHDNGIYCFSCKCAKKLDIKQNVNSDNKMDEIYPDNVHCSIQDKTLRNFALKTVKLNHDIFKDDLVDEIINIKSDNRVIFMPTAAHGYYVIMNFPKYNAGTIIGEEDEGVSKYWKKKLNWSTQYGP